MPGSLIYENGIKAFAIHLIISQMVALNRVQKQIAAMIGSIISEASLLKIVFRLYQALEEWEARPIELLLTKYHFGLRVKIIGFTYIPPKKQP